MAERKLQCEVAGKIVRIEAPAGARVAPDDPILIVESMKMEIPLVAPVAGMVSGIHVAEGDEVAEGQHAATLEI
ncbi:MAG: biotinylated protein [Betaproteobacteria bacterium SG8_39]|nr:MAG: biotinylated protein [Betaproteobacteria bacterium SG8_39]